MWAITPCAPRHTSLTSWSSYTQMITASLLSATPASEVPSTAPRATSSEPTSGLRA